MPRPLVTVELLQAYSIVTGEGSRPEGSSEGSSDRSRIREQAYSIVTGEAGPYLKGW